MSSSHMESRAAVDDLIARTGAEAERLATGVWGDTENERVAVAFEQCAVAALRAPVLAERSIVLRRVGKRVIPRALVPTVKRVVKVADAMSRRVVEMLASRRSRS